MISIFEIILIYSCVVKTNYTLVSLRAVYSMAVPSVTLTVL